MSRIAIEDEFNDIVGKAMNGLRLSAAELARKSGVPVDSIEAIARGQLPDEVSLAKIAPALGLEPNALVRSAMKIFYPRPVQMDGLALFNSDYRGAMTVNAYIIWDPQSLEAAIFDTGTDALRLVEFLQQKNLSAANLFLTHTHPDHIAETEALRQRLGVTVRSNAKEPYEGSETFEEGARFTIGQLSVETAMTWGHSQGGTTYIVRGLENPIAVTGDALFAGSMGGGMVSYQDALETTWSKILTLPDETVVCPGHGPMSTVAEEKRHNPFFAGRV